MRSGQDIINQRQGGLAGNPSAGNSPPHPPRPHRQAVCSMSLSAAPTAPFGRGRPPTEAHRGAPGPASAGNSPQAPALPCAHKAAVSTSSCKVRTAPYGINTYTGTSWSGWQSLSGKLTASPAATSPTSGVFDVFVRGTDGAIWERTTTNGGSSWSAWSGIGGQLASGTGPAVCSQGSRLDVFVQGTDGALWHKTYTGTSWSGWQSLSGKLTASPAATSPGNNLVDVFARGTDGAVWYKAWDGIAWSNWRSPGGRLASNTGPAASS